MQVPAFAGTSGIKLLCRVLAFGVLVIGRAGRLGICFRAGHAQIFFRLFCGGLFRGYLGLGDAVAPGTVMGAVANGALDAGGEVIGVIPQALVDMEVANPDCTELHVVDTMHQRKQAFTDLSDGFVTLPGGVGTLDELWEAVSWAQLGYHQNPVGLLNAFGYYDGLIAFNRQMAETGFVRAMHRDILIVGKTLEELLEKMANYQPIRTIVQMKAEDL